MVRLRSQARAECDQECHLVTGGGGYAGLNLGIALNKEGHRVILFDLHEPLYPVPEDITFVQVCIKINQLQIFIFLLCNFEFKIFNHL